MKKRILSQRRSFGISCAAVLMIGLSAGARADQIVDGDLRIDNITNHASGMYQSRTGSVIIEHKVDDHSNVVIRAAKNVQVGEKIDQHSQVTIVAGGSVSIGQKVDQHSVAMITAERGNVNIGEKIDQHSWARISVPNGCLDIGQGVDQHSHLHYQARCGSIGSVVSGSTADHDMAASWDRHESGPGS